MDVTPRQAPNGQMLEDGYQVLVTFETNPDIALWEKTIKPSGMDGGEAIDITTQHNVLMRTGAPRSLVTATPMTMTCAYDPAVLDDILALLNVETIITVTYPDGTYHTIAGFLQLFDPQDMSEGNHPEASVTIGITNRDPSSKAEVQPEYHAGTGG